ncbi:hypothetical protein Cni_G17113 [Canna indica]|uniref:SWIM-type domain-containing protein n=1 Tax=Canna indica TaxID=4628 RepID=A0AAQ3KIR4_9LILI|nr:hypothetical protein Cni_G17113 [Canna indica]
MEESDLNRTLSELEATSPPAHEAFVAIGMNKFCQAYVGTTCKSDNVTNNISETFNSYILNARSKSIVDMLEDIRRMLMQRMYVKNEMMLKSMDEICPNIRKKLEKCKEDSRFCTVTPSGNLKFEVQCLDKVHVVNLVIRSCSCRSWDLSGIPCNHAISCINWTKEEPEKYVSEYYKREVYLKAYANLLEPLREKEAWSNVDGPPLLPPKVKKIPGRPKKVRRREMHEDNRQCTKYTSKVITEEVVHLGHNQLLYLLMKAKLDHQLVEVEEEEDLLVEAEEKEEEDIRAQLDHQLVEIDYQIFGCLQVKKLTILTTEYGFLHVNFIHVTVNIIMLLQMPGSGLVIGSSRDGVGQLLENAFNHKTHLKFLSQENLSLLK